MTIKNLSVYLHNEYEAENYLIKSGILKQFDKCYTCGSSHLGRVRRGKYKCYNCNAEWNLRKGSFLERRKISLGEFIGVVKLFSDGINAIRCAEELEINPKLTRVLYIGLREKLLGSDNINNKFVSEGSLYIQKSNGEIKIVSQPHSDNKSNLKFIRAKDEKATYYYKLEYRNSNQKSILKIIERIDELDMFYRYCQERLLNFRGRNLNSMIELLQELAFRFNHRDEDFFKILINKLIL